MLRGPVGVVVVGNIGDVHPAVRHFVHGAIAVADPLIGIRIVLVRFGVVVPRRHVNDRPLRKHRRGVIVVDVICHPVEVEVADVADDLGRAVRQDRGQLHRRSAKMHVRLKVLEARRLLQHHEPFVLRDRVRRDIQRPAQTGEGREVCAVLRLLPFRVQPDAELNCAGDFLADRVDVLVPRDFRAGQEELPGIGSIEVELLANRPFHQHCPAIQFAVAASRKAARILVILSEVCDGVMDDSTALDRPRPHFDGAHPSGLRDGNRRDRPEPGVLMLRRHRIRRRGNDQIRLPEQLRRLPFVVGRPLSRRRQVVGVAERRAAIHPLSDCCDLLVGQRHVVLELLDADRLVDVPRRHLPRRDALLDRPRPRTRLFVGDERHRRN